MLLAQLFVPERLTYYDLILNPMVGYGTLMMNEHKKENISEKGHKTKKICMPKDAYLTMFCCRNFALRD